MNLKEIQQQLTNELTIFDSSIQKYLKIKNDYTEFTSLREMIKTKICYLYNDVSNLSEIDLSEKYVDISDE